MSTEIGLLDLPKIDKRYLKTYRTSKHCIASSYITRLKVANSVVAAKHGIFSKLVKDLSFKFTILKQSALCYQMHNQANGSYINRVKLHCQ